MKTFTIASILLSAVSLVSGHARIRQPKPLGYGTAGLDGNAYNNPLAHDGSDFPCKGLIGKADMTPQAKWSAGSKGMFEIWPNEGNGGEGNMAGHSGGSCQASISFDKGKSFKVLHSYEGGCPRDVPLNSNIGGPNQTYTFDVPSDTKSGDAIFAWSWIARTGNRGEFYMNCASVTIEGSGTSTLDNYPDMYVGDLTVGDIKTGMCVSTAETNLEYPFPGEKVTRTEDGRFQGPKGPGPNGGFEVCRAPGSSGPGGDTPYDGGNDEEDVPPPTETTYPTDPTPSDAPTDEVPPEDDKPYTPPKEDGSKPPFDQYKTEIGGYTYECRLVKQA